MSEIKKALERACKELQEIRQTFDGSVSIPLMQDVLIALGLESLTVNCLRCGASETISDIACADDVKYYWVEDGTFRSEATMGCTRDGCDGTMYGWKEGKQ